MTFYDLVIVGGGPAGVGTAYQLRESGLAVKLLEAAGQVGGRTKSVTLPGGAANAGAQFVYVGTRTHELVEELGLDTIPFEPRTYGIAYKGVTSVGCTNDEVVSGLPLTDGESAELLRLLDDSVNEYATVTAGGVFTDRAEGLASITVAERLEGLSPRVREIVATAIRAGAVGEASEIIAQYALRYFASYPAHETRNRRVLIDGMQSVVLAMAERLDPGAISTSASVTKVEFDPIRAVYTVTAVTPEGETEFEGREVLLAVPAPLIEAIVPRLPEWKKVALDAASTPGNTTMVIAADVSDVPEHRDWGMVTTVGHRFDCILNSTPGRWRSADEPGIVHYMCYANQAGYQPNVPGNRVAEEEWLEDFLSVAPALRGRIRGHHIQTWQHCFALLGLERADALSEIRRPVDGLHFAGDWSSTTAGSHGAFVEADRVAADVVGGRGL
ncbi:flavin monoamine oxidase family protein [Sinomonas mesophila]|uniref:flavin monoamine oxidase family protein n=1 Tax=Sinomonas mesophila TaxID=1531955 RepID=UPI00098573B3|nr:FAD-dependent oxidoreductase [Sinomonas mesophila]